MAKRLPAVALCSLTLFGLPSCETWWSEEPVQVVIPSVPPALADRVAPPAFRLEWFDTTGKPRRTAVAAGEGRTWVDLTRRPGSPVLAYPLLTSFGDFAHPAGGIVPDSFSEDGRFVLTWDNGFLASVLRDLADRGIATTGINTQKLSRRIETVAGRDSWNLDRVVLLEEIAGGSLSARSVRMRDLFDVDLPLPPGVWLGQDLRTPPLVVPEDPTLGRTTIYRSAIERSATPQQRDAPDAGVPTVRAVGYHRLLDAETGRILALSVADGGACDMLPIWPRY